MRVLLAVVALAVAVPRGGTRGCASEAGPADVRAEPHLVEVDVVPPDGDLRVRCLPAEVAATWMPRGDAWAVPSGDRVPVDGPCTLHVYRLDGALWVRSAPFALAAEDRVVTVRLPPGPIGGIGVGFATGLDGVRVVGVHPGTPADGQLVPGDRIRAVDGVPVAGIDDWGFIGLGTGPVGSEAVLEVDGADGPREVRLVRAPYDLARAR